ncbi:MAG TPA: hypothetical protein VK916_06840 [Gillisia sp.]|nr:hypothetical protein [Gillisia sp.]
MNKFPRNFLNFYINSSLHVAIAVVCLSAVSLLNFGVDVDYPLLVFIFLGTITGYNFVKFAGVAGFQHSNLPKNLRAIQIFSFLIFVGLIISIIYQPFEILTIAVVAGGLTLLYALPVFSESRNLRAIPGLKIYVIGMVVSIVTVIMPLYLNVNIWQQNVILVFVQRFILVIALVLPFEIRDLKFDRAQLGTIPQRIGVSRTKIIGYFLVLVVVLLEFLKQEVRPVNVYGLVVTGIVTILFLKGSTINQGEYYASVWVEAIPILWFLLLFGMAGGM